MRRPETNILVSNWRKLTIVFRNWAPLTSRLRQTKGGGRCGCRLSVKSRIACTSCAMLAKLASGQGLSGEDAEPDFHLVEPALPRFGVKWKGNVGVCRQPVVVLFVGGEVVEG